MDRWVDRVAVVTGASAGIGAAISKRLAEAGLKVVGFARRVEKVEELSRTCQGSGKLIGMKCDVSKQEDVVKAFKWVKENVGPVQIIVNNAGLLKLGTLLDGNPDDWRIVMDTNVMGLAMCSKEAFQQMKEANLEGHIIHINSIAGHFIFGDNPGLFANVYSPSKHAVTCITEIMRKEITHSKLPVKVTSISPGLVETEASRDAVLEKANYSLPYLKAEDVSDAVHYVISTPPNVNIQELMIRPVGEGF